MKYFKNVLGLTLVGVLVLASLTGCSSNSTADADTATESTSTTNTTTTFEASDDDIIMEAVGIPRDTIVMTVNGEGVTAERYAFWILDMINSYYTDETFWDEDINGQTVEEYVIEQADYGSTLYAVVENKAAELGVAVTEEQWAELDLQMEETIAYLEEEGTYTFQYILDAQGISLEAFHSINAIYYLYQGIYEAATAEGGEAEFTDSSVDEYLESVGYYNTKHILLSNTTTDDEGNSVELTDAEMAALLVEAEGYVAQIRASSDVEATFDEIMNARSDDLRYTDGTLAYPDGYEAYTDQMVSEYEEASLALAVGEVSDPVETMYGYHIIFRLPVADEESLLADVDSWLMAQLLDTWVAEATIEKTDLLDELQPRTLYSNLAVILAEEYGL